MDDSHSERQPPQPGIERERLRQEIDKVSIEIAGFERAVEGDEAFFNRLHFPITQWSTDDPPRYEQMIHTQRKLEMAQQKLSTLILELLKMSSDQLDIDVRELGKLSVQLDSDVKKVGESSGWLERLTIVLILLTSLDIVDRIINSTPPLSYVGIPILILIIIGLIYLTVRTRTEVIRRKLTDSNSR